MTGTREVQTWRRLDNVLRDNDLLTEEQMKKLGSKHKRYVPPAESKLVLVDRF